VRPLAKVVGWRGAPPPQPSPAQVHSALEVAYDAETAQRQWEEDVPPTLAQRTGELLEPGRYGDPFGIEFDDQVLAPVARESVRRLSGVARRRAPG